MSENILIVEDDEKMARMIELELSHEGYSTSICGDGISGLEAAEKGGVDLILLDIMLPGLSGIEVLRRLRKTRSTPVILLTARDEIVDKVLGLDSGADDYITKPFAIEELLARIRASLRAAAANDSDSAAAPPSALAAESHIISACGLTMDTERHTVSYEGDPLELTLKEFDLLHCLMINKGIVLTRDLLLDRVWGYDYIGESNTIDVYIRFLRSKIDERYGVRLITTVRGIGYKLDEPVKSAAEGKAKK